MRHEQRTVLYDTALRVEAYCFQGIMQPFPKHFHEQYVIGMVERGQRTLACKNTVRIIGRGDVVLFQPGDDHACAPCGEEPFDYRGFHIPQNVMLELTEEVTGRRMLPGFAAQVIEDEELARRLRSLHVRVMSGAPALSKEEDLLLLMTALMQKYGQPFQNGVPECPQEMERVCDYMRQHVDQRMTLDQLCRCAGVSKSTLLRAFTRAKGVTPYRYAETLRINAARTLLDKGASPMEAALRTGFSDQSHFTHAFSSVIGVAPGAYRAMLQGKAAVYRWERKGMQHGCTAGKMCHDS